jgi:hypothetical protein
MGMLLGGSRWDNSEDNDHSMFCHYDREEEELKAKLNDRSMFMHVDDDEFVSDDHCMFCHKDN